MMYKFHVFGRQSTSRGESEKVLSKEALGTFSLSPLDMVPKILTLFHKNIFMETDFKKFSLVKKMS